MSFLIKSVELIFYKNGIVDLISIDGDFYKVSGPSKDDPSVYNIPINKSYGKKIIVKVYSNDQNITEMFSTDSELSEKITTDDFTLRFDLD